MREIFFTAGVCMIAAGVCLGADPPASQVNLATGAAIRFGEARVELHVAPDGDDAGTGDASTPLRTVGQAVKTAARQSDLGKAVRIVVHPGIYREEVSVPKHTCETPGVLSIDSETAGEAVLCGSDAWQDGWSLFRVEDEEWKWFAGDDRFRDARIFRHDWSHAWEQAENPWGDSEIILDPVVKRTEMVFMNGIPLRPVAAFGELREGTFHVNTDVKKLYVWPPAGTEPQTALTEVAIRAGVLDTGGRNNVALRGLVFRQARGATQRTGLLVNGSRNVLVENCRFEWNGWNGTGCANSEDVTYRKCTAENNGIGGMGAYQTRNLLIEDSVDAHNNWRGRMGGFVNWANGSKFFSTRRLTVRRHKAYGNESCGLWIDYDNRDVLLENVELKDNLLAGAFLEASQGPILMRDCTISGNRVGVMDGRSDNVTLVHNRIFNNRDAQVLFSGDPKGRDITEFDSKTKLYSKSRNWRIEGNTLETDSRSAFLVLVARHISDVQWESIRQEIQVLKNTYVAPADAVFRVRDKSFTLEEWQRLYHLDLDSRKERGQIHDGKP